MNSGDIGILSPSLPASILYTASAIFLVVLLLVFWRVKNRVANFVIFAMWFRYVATAHHVIMFKSSFLGLSWIALGSVTIFVLGLLVIRPRDWMRKFLLPCYMLICVVIISGLLNHSYSGLINVTVKYGYFLVVTLGVFEALEQIGERRFMPMLLWTFAPSLVLQVLSIILGIDKANEADGSASFIGGYHHEAAFSIVLATCFVVACFADSLKSTIKNGILLTCLVGIFFANYRTTIVAIAPLATAHFAFGIVRRFRHHQRAAVAIGMVLVAAGGLIVVGWVLQQRFEDLAVVAESGVPIKPPTEFSTDERRMMSGRPHIWSTYIYAYMNGATLQHLVGFGPESWASAFTTYAHNTLVSVLYEYGVIGIIFFLYFWVFMTFAAFRVRHGPKGKLLAAHASWILLNMATMPFWMIEGIILYGIICGYTLYLLQEGPQQILARNEMATPRIGTSRHSRL